MPEQSTTWPQRHPILVYSAARVTLFAAAFALLALVGARGLLLLALAFLISGLLSLVLLNGPRSHFSERVAGFFGRINERIDAAARAEDDEVDADTDDPAPRDAAPRDAAPRDAAPRDPA